MEKVYHALIAGTIDPEEKGVSFFSPFQPDEYNVVWLSLLSKKRNTQSDNVILVSSS